MRNESTIIFFHCWWQGDFSAGCLWLHLLQVLSLPHCPHTPGATGCGHISPARTSSGPAFACPYAQWVGPGSADMSLAAHTHWSQAVHLLRVMWTIQILPSKPKLCVPQRSLSFTAFQLHLQSFNSSRQQRQQECKWGQETVDGVKFSGKKMYLYNLTKSLWWYHRTHCWSLPGS